MMIFHVAIKSLLSAKRNFRQNIAVVLILASLFTRPTSGNAQMCNTTAATTNAGAITPTGTWQTVTAASGGRRFYTFTATAGCTYDFSTCGNTNDTYLRLYSGTVPASAVLQTSNDDNGAFCTGAQASLSWVCGTAGTYSILVTNYVCANLSVNTNLLYRVTCLPPYNPCTTIPTITCGTANTTTFASGTGAYNPVATSCGFATPGKEYLFSFTPTTTGNYTISEPTSFGYIDWFYKPASGGCSGTGWTCIDDISNANLGNANVNIPLTAGTTYYIMGDPETSTGGSVTWTLNCPPVITWNPCTTIPTITCGTANTTTFAAGTGAYNPVATTCGFGTPGTEYIFSFTPAVTGNYTISEPTSFGYIDWFYKPASGGCSGTGWTCIDDISNANLGNANVNIPLTAGTTYYIMGDPESSTGGSVTWTLNCPVAAAANDNCASAVAITSLPYTSPVTSNNPSTDDVPTSTSGCGTQGSNLWYTVVGNGNTLTATTCNASTSFDTEVRIYTGNCSALNSMVEVVCNDDYAACASGALQSTVSWCSTAGVTYYISVGYFAAGAGYGNFVLSVTNGPVCAPLPIELTAQNVTCEEMGVKMTWQTATETNNDFYSIERSSDGVNFALVSTVPGAGSTTMEHDYQFIDKDPLSGTSYYRLKQTDFNGSNNYFRVLSVDCLVNTENILVYPNPTHSLFTVSGTSAGVELIITDAYGRKVLTKMTEGRQTIVDLDGMSKGIYYLLVNNSTGGVRRKIILD